MVADLMAQPLELGLTLAVAVVHRGRLVAEGYGPETTAETTLISWSTAKSVTHAVVGLLVGDGRLQPHEAGAGRGVGGATPRTGITLQHLLEMRSGLRFAEEYLDAGASDVIEMLFGAGQDDVAAFAAGFPARPRAGHRVELLVRYHQHRLPHRRTTRSVAGPMPFAPSSSDRLFGPLGMATASPRFDDAGTFVGSSFLYATAQDFARFGYLYLRDGTWDGARLLPEGWVDHARAPVPVPVPATEEFGYGAHWWLWHDYLGAFAAHGYEGQYVIVVPDRDLVVVRLGKTPAELRPNLLVRLRALMDRVAPEPVTWGQGRPSVEGCPAL